MRLTVALAVACVISGASIAGEAQAAIRRSTHIPAQNLGEALQTLAQHCNVQVVYFSTSVDVLRTAGAVGELTTDEAFTRILAGTGLTYRYLGDKTITIVPVATPGSGEFAARESAGSIAGDSNPQAPSASYATPRPQSFWSRLRLAQLATPATGTESPPRAAADDGDAALSRDSIELEEIVVTGSHIRGVQNPTVPVIILDKEYIDSTGLTTATRLIESLPQNFALANQSTSSGSGLLSGTSLSTTQGSSINLRGVGEGTTLVLLNGRRMATGYSSAAVDITALPLSAVERVEVVTDGASAVYGSDAVGGVVNFVLRSDYDGAETRLRAGVADGTDEYRLSQTFGTNWGSGNVVVSGEYYQRDLLLTTDRDLGTRTATSTIGSLLPEEDNYSLMSSARQRLSDSISVFGDVLYTQRDSFNKGSRITASSDRSYTTDNAQTSAALGFDWNIGGGWRLETYGSHGRDDLQTTYADPLSASRSGGSQIDFKSDALQIKADGPLLSLPGGTVRAAVGGSRREEEAVSLSRNFGPTGNLTSTIGYDQDREVNSAFAEVLVPLVGDGNAIPLVRRLELSATVRHDDYSDFGSSTDPRIGLAWEPVSGLTLRGSWGTSYLAPKLSSYNVGFNAAVAQYTFDPGLGRVSRQLIVGGNSPESLQAQESKNYSFGIDWVPESLDAKLSIGYYNIDYRDRVTTPPTNTVVLGDPASYGDLFIRNPTIAQLNQYIGYGLLGQGFLALDPANRPDPSFNPATIEVIVDLRARNMSVVKTDGIDLSAQYDIDALGGRMHFALDGTYVLELVNQATETSAPIDLVNTFSNPPHLRMRGQVGYRHSSWAVNGFVHFVDSYDDNRVQPFREIDSWLTADVNVSYRFADGAGALAKTTISLGATNVFDEAPPRTLVRTNNFDLGFDPTNASALGRLVTLEVSRQW
jgi:iron complex outermembrane receptor protein